MPGVLAPPASPRISSSTCPPPQRSIHPVLLLSRADSLQGISPPTFSALWRFSRRVGGGAVPTCTGASSTRVPEFWSYRDGKIVGSNLTSCVLVRTAIHPTIFFPFRIVRATGCKLCNPTQPQPSQSVRRFLSSHILWAVHPRPSRHGRTGPLSSPQHY